MSTSSHARTLEEVARISGVSRSTVSRVVNGGSVSAETRRKVMEAVEATGYRPNLAARSLASARTGIVGLVLHARAADLRCDWYAVGLHQGITEALSERSAGVMEWFSHRPWEEIVASIVAVRLLDGVIVTTEGRDDPLVTALVDAGIPIVVVGRHSMEGSVDLVRIDDRAGAIGAVDHLLACGAHRIGHVVGDRWEVSALDRLEGYYEALDGAEVVERIVADGGYSPSAGQQGAEKLLDMNVDAVFAASDYAAVGVYRAAAERGIRIPESLQVVGFDDMWESASMEPPLTTVRQDPVEIGRVAADLLFSSLDASTGPATVVVPTSLVVRESTRSRPVG